MVSGKQMYSVYMFIFSEPENITYAAELFGDQFSDNRTDQNLQPDQKNGERAKWPNFPPVRI